MPKKKEKEEIFLEFEIYFPKAPKKAKDRQSLFNRTLFSIEESKESLPIEISSKKRKKQIILDSDEFMFSISFEKRLLTKVVVHDPEKNLETTNRVGNKVISCINTILGKSATGSRVRLIKTILSPKKTLNLAKKIIGEARMIRINEKVKQTLSPIGVMFEYRLNEREFMFAPFSNERGAQLFTSRTIYKESLPFNVMQKEYDELEHPAKIIKILTDMEL